MTVWKMLKIIDVTIASVAAASTGTTCHENHVKGFGFYFRIKVKPLKGVSVWTLL